MILGKVILNFRNCSNSQSYHWYSGGHTPYGLCHHDLRVSNTALLCKMSKTTYSVVMEKQEWASIDFPLSGGGGGGSEGQVC